jgi:hypothetical protein
MRTPRQAALFAASIVVTTLALWSGPLRHAGISRIAHDLVIDQAQRTMPGRVLPLPYFSGWLPMPTFELSVPIAISDHGRLGLLLAAGALLATLLVPLRLLARASQTRSARISFLLCGFALTTLPQALQRTDYSHVAFGIPLTVAAVFCMFSSRISAPLLAAALLPWFMARPHFSTLEEIEKLWAVRDDVRFVSADRALIAQFVEKEVGPDEPIYVGCESHSQAMISAIDLYYVTKRVGATRYMQFDPGTVTSPDGQAEMIADLERTQPLIALRSPSCAWYEPNASQLPGAGLLDAYFASHYELSNRLPGFNVWRRK